MTPTPKRGAEFYRFEGVLEKLLINHELSGVLTHFWIRRTDLPRHVKWYRRTDIKWCQKNSRFRYATFLHMLKMCRMAETFQFFRKYFAGHFLSIILYNINNITYTTQTRFALVIMTKKGQLRTSSKASSTCTQIFLKTEIFVSVYE